jgi:WD40 repeat protein
VPLFSWRLNLLEFDETYIASEYDIKIISRSSKEVVGDFQLPRRTGLGLGLGRSSHMPGINQIKLGKIGDSPKLLVVNGEGFVGLFDPAEWRRPPLILRTEYESTWGCDMHSSGLVAVSDNSHTITLFDLKSNKSKVMSQHHNNIPSVSFSKDGSHLISASIDGTAIVWNVKTGMPINYAADLRPNWLWRALLLDTEMIHLVDSEEWDDIIPSLSIWEEDNDNRSDIDSIQSCSSFGTQTETEKVVVLELEDDDLWIDDPTAEPEKDLTTYPFTTDLLVMVTSEQTVSLTALDNPLFSFILPDCRIEPQLRLTLLEYLSEFSAILVGSQSGGRIGLYSIMKRHFCDDRYEFKLKCKGSLVVNGNLSGFKALFRSNGYKSWYDVMALKEDMTLLTFRIMQVIVEDQI